MPSSSLLLIVSFLSSSSRRVTALLGRGQRICLSCTLPPLSGVHRSSVSLFLSTQCVSPQAHSCGLMSSGCMGWVWISFLVQWCCLSPWSSQKPQLKSQSSMGYPPFMILHKKDRIIYPLYAISLRMRISPKTYLYALLKCEISFLKKMRRNFHSSTHYLFLQVYWAYVKRSTYLL